MADPKKNEFDLSYVDARFRGAHQYEKNGSFILKGEVDAFLETHKDVSGLSELKGFTQEKFNTWMKTGTFDKEGWNKKFDELAKNPAVKKVFEADYKKIDEENEKIKEIEETLKEPEKKLKQAQEKLKGSEGKIKNCETSIKETDQEIKELQARIKTVKKARDESGSSPTAVDSAEKRIAKYTGEMADKIAKRDSLKEEINTQKEEIKTHKKDITEQTKKINAHKKDINAHKEIISGLGLNVIKEQTLNKEHDRLKKSLEEQQKQKKQNEAENHNRVWKIQQIIGVKKIRGSADLSPEEKAEADKELASMKASGPVASASSTHAASAYRPEPVPGVRQVEGGSGANLFLHAEEKDGRMNYSVHFSSDAIAKAKSIFGTRESAFHAVFDDVLTIQAVELGLKHTTIDCAAPQGYTPANIRHMIASAKTRGMEIDFAFLRRPEFGQNADANEIKRIILHYQEEKQQDVARMKELESSYKNDPEKHSKAVNTGLEKTLQNGEVQGKLLGILGVVGIPLPGSDDETRLKSFAGRISKYAEESKGNLTQAGLRNYLMQNMKDSDFSLMARAAMGVKKVAEFFGLAKAVRDLPGSDLVGRAVDAMGGNSRWSLLNDRLQNCEALAKTFFEGFDKEFKAARGTPELAADTSKTADKTSTVADKMADTTSTLTSEPSTKTSEIELTTTTAPSLSRRGSESK